ncbi:MAG: Hsp20/alpha crystallin family protein [Patescibacteria group bacterium]|nr:Hsp20/alpha crystallin family protein [Patescibacteria group bacterium]
MAFFNITSIKSKSQNASQDPAEPNTPDQEEGQLAVDILETPNNIVVLAPIAGVISKDVKITLSDDVLTISGERHFPEDLKKNERYFAQECYWGEFSRSIVLPSVVDSNHVKAKFRDGVLHIIIPKAEKYNAKIIEVEE